MIELKHIAVDWQSFEDYRQKRIKGIKSGFKLLDATLMGLPGMVGVLGQPGSYKSTFLMHISANHAKEYGPVLYYDVENGLNRLRFRLLCHLAHLSTVDLLHYKDTEFLMKTLSECPIYIFDKLLIEELEPVIEHGISISKQGRVMLVLDSLQSLPLINDNKRYSIDTWLDEINFLKKKYESKLTILASIEKKKGTYEMIGMDCAKESGNIEYKMEAMLDINTKFDKENPMKKTVVVNCIKDRDGPSNARIVLEPVLVNKEDPASFCYTLREVENVEF